MLSTAKSANVRFLQVVQLFAPPTMLLRTSAQNSFYKFGEKIFWVSAMCAQILSFSRVYG